MPFLLFVACVLTFGGCQRQWYGAGTIYVWNGSDAALKFQIAGRAFDPALSTRLRSERGELLENVIAGSYRVVFESEEGSDSIQQFDVVKDRLTIVNAGAQGCFGRFDVAGMFRKKSSKPVRLLETYVGQESIQIVDDISILPGRRIPNEVRRVNQETVLQRLLLIPCDLVDPNGISEAKVIAFAKRIH